MTVRMTPSLRPLTRRAVTGLAVVTAGVGLTGCDTDLPGPVGPVGPVASPPGTGRSDLGVLGEALDAERRLLRTLERTADRHPRLRTPLAAAVAVHTAHVSLLAGAAEEVVPTPGPVTGTGRPVPDRPQAAVRQVADDEAALVIAHTGLAVRADSGPFARVLASFAAAAAQQEQALRALRVTGRATS